MLALFYRRICLHVSCLLLLILLLINGFTYYFWMDLESHATPQYHWIQRPLMAALDRWRYHHNLSTDLHPIVVANPKCDALIVGDNQQIKQTQNMLYKETRAKTTEYDLVHQAKNCAAFWGKNQFTSIMIPSKLELEFPIAYILTLHKNAEQAVKLLRAIYAPQNAYCIHIDKKASFQFHHAIQEIVNCFPNMFIATKLENVVYAGFTRLQADINCMQDLVRSNAKWSYVINLCGQDFPLKTNLEIVQHLINLGGKNDIPGIIPDDKLHQDRINYIHEIKLENGEKVVVPTSNLKSSPPHNITIFFGTAYNLFSRQFVEFVLNNATVHELLKWMEDIYSPDENFWITVNRLPGTPGGSTKPSWETNARIIKWSFFGGKKYPHCQGIYQRTICIYGVGDLNWLLAQPHLFANKFDLDVDHVVVQCLDYHLKRKYSDQRQQLTTARPLVHEEILQNFHFQMKKKYN